MLNEQELTELVFEHVCEHHPEAVAEMKDEEILRRAGEAVRRALTHGFQKESSVAAFGALTFLISPNFDQQRSIRAALASKHLNPDARMEKIFELTKEEDWDEAAGL